MALNGVNARALSEVAGPALSEVEGAPSLDDALHRVSAYLQQWVPQLANVVSTEVYEERSAAAGRTQSRRLKSDVLLVQYPGGPGWMMFRDVAEADGRSLAHSPDR